MKEKEFQSLVEEVCKEYNIEKETLLNIIIRYEEAQNSDSSFYINPLKELDNIDWGFDRKSQKRRIEFIIEKWNRYKHIFDANKNDFSMLI